MSETKPKEKATPKTKEAKRGAWSSYYKANKAKYRAWARGWRSGSKLTPEEFNKKWEAERKKKAEKK
jgi:hypothetical protein